MCYQNKTLAKKYRWMSIVDRLQKNLVIDEIFVVSFMYLLSLGVTVAESLNLGDTGYQIRGSGTFFSLILPIILLLINIIFFFFFSSKIMRFAVFLSIIWLTFDNIISFAEIYKLIGLVHGQEKPSQDPFVALYFSVTTWTTVGLGDFVPADGDRVYALIEPILSHFVMAVIVGLGAIIFLTDQYDPKKLSESSEGIWLNPKIISWLYLRSLVGEFNNSILRISFYYFISFLFPAIYPIILHKNDLF